MEKLDTLHSERSKKYECYSHVIKNAEAESKALKTRAKVLTNLAKQLRKTLLNDMIQHGERRTNAGKFRLRCCGKSRVVVHIGAVDLPEKYQRITADRYALRKDLDANKAIEGVKLEFNEYIEITVKP